MVFAALVRLSKQVLWLFVLTLVAPLLALGPSAPTSAGALGSGDVSKMSLAAAVTLSPVADTYVDQTHPTTNYGTAAELRADRSPVQYGFMRFNVSGLAGSVSQAVLRVWTNNALASGFNLYRVANNTWGETSLTSSNAPMPGTLIGSATNCAASAWADVDVTAYVTGNGTFSFALINLNTDALSVSSREGAHAPQLIIATSAAATATPTRTTAAAATATRTATSAPTATRTTAAVATATRTPTTKATATRTATTAPTATRTAVVAATATRTAITAPTATRTAAAVATATRTPTTAATVQPTPLANTVSLSAVADAYVDQTYPTTNYGTAAELRADRSPVQYGFLRFNVSGLSGSVSQAVLRVWTNNALASGFNLYRVANNTWGETSLTSSNAPAPGTLIGAATNCAASAWANVDVTAYVTGNGTFSFALINLNTDALSVSSREGAHAPQLIIATSAVPAATRTPTTGATATRTPSAQATSTPASRKLVFSDEFNGTSLNTAVWGTCFPWLSQSQCTLTGNSELQLYQPDDSYLDGSGHLILKTEKRTVNGFNYTSGMVTSKPGYSFQYGYAEARVKVPSGRGLWPAFWLMPTDGSWPPEIDIMEILGHEPTRTYLTYHWGSSNSQSQYQYSGPNFSADWHTFAADWQPGVIIWYVDGVERGRYTNSAVTNKSMYLLFNLAVGGTWPGSPDSSTVFPSTYQVDYVRVYQ